VFVTSQRQSGYDRWQRCITVSCLLLVLVFAAVEAVHVHSNAEISRHSGTPCLVCISAHSNAPALIAHHLPVLVAVVAVLVPYEVEATGFDSRLELFTRPPPLF